MLKNSLVLWFRAAGQNPTTPLKKHRGGAPDPEAADPGIGGNRRGKNSVKNNFKKTIGFGKFRTLGGPEPSPTAVRWGWPTNP
jgi:hypothetical protein